MSDSASAEIALKKETKNLSIVKRQTILLLVLAVNNLNFSYEEK